MASSIVVAVAVLCAGAPTTDVAVWKNGPVSAASIKGGTLKVPLPNEPSGLAGLAPKPPSRGNAASAGLREDSTPVLKLKLLVPTLAPALPWHRLHPTPRKDRRPASAPGSDITTVPRVSSLVRPV